MRAAQSLGPPPTRREKARTVLPYVLGSVTILAGFVVLYLDRTAGVLLTVGGVWLLPAVRRGIRDRVGADLPRGTLLVVAVLLIGGAVALHGALPGTTSAEFRSFESQLEEEGFEVERAFEEDGRWVVAFYPAERGPGGMTSSVNDIARRYAEAVPASEEQPGHEELRITVLRANGDPFVHYTVRADWARAFAEDRMSRDGFLARIHDSGSIA